MTLIARDDITGLVLAGGRGSRMGGADKGLQNVNGIPLALFTLLRLQQQVGRTMVSANRNLSAYESMGVPVWPDSMDGYLGPLAGLLSGLEHAETGWLVTVPCDTPGFPSDLVDRLAEAVAEKGARVAMAATLEDGQLRARAEFCLVHTDLIESLVARMHAGERDLEGWAMQHGAALVPFDEGADFLDANTAEDLRQLQRVLVA